MSMSGFVSGRVTHDAELRNIQEKTVINFRVAVERDYTNKKGEREVDYLPLVAWDKTATVLAPYLKQGNLIEFDVNDFRLNRYEKDGEKYTSIVGTVSQFDVLAVADRNRAKANEEVASDSVADVAPSQPAETSDATFAVAPEDLPF